MSRSTLGRWVPRNNARTGYVLLSLAMLISAVFSLWMVRDRAFFADEWFIYSLDPGISVDQLLRPENGNLVLIPTGLDRVLLKIFGAESAVPFDIANVVLLETVGLLLYLYLKRCWGYLGALPPTVLVLFFGAGYDMVLPTHGRYVLVMLCAVLAAFLVFDPRSVGRKLCTCALLTAAVASQAIGVPATIGAVFLVRGDGARPWLKDIWVVAVPIFVFLVWRHFYLPGDIGALHSGNIVNVPQAWLDSLAGVLAGLTGLFGAGEPSVAYGAIPDAAYEFGRIFAVLAVLGCAVAFVRRRSAFSGEFLAIVVILVVAWTLQALAGGPNRDPLQSRYVFVGAVLVLMAIADLTSRMGYGPRAAFVSACICALALVPNIGELVDAGRFFRSNSDQDRATLGAADLVANTASGNLLIEDPPRALSPLRVQDMAFTMSQYLGAKAAYGSPAYSEKEIAGAPEEARVAADEYLSLADPVEVGPGKPRKSKKRIKLLTYSNGSVKDKGTCLILRPDTYQATASFLPPRSGFFVRAASGTPLNVSLRRFADEFPSAYPPPVLPAGRGYRFRLGSDSIEARWKAQVTSDQPVQVCV